MSCPDCFKGSAKDGTPTGKLTTLYGKAAYVASPPKTTSQSAIIYLPDAFGFKFINNQLLADTYASIVTIFRVLFVAIPFATKAKPEKAFPGILEFARAVKKDLPVGGKLGVSGFCWGGFSSTMLCLETAAPDSKERLIEAQFCAHPSGLDLPRAIIDAVTTHKVPYSMAAAQEDMMLSLKSVDATEAALRQQAGTGDGENGYNYEIVTYPKCSHGFAVRAKPDSDVETEAAGKACEQAISWFGKWL
ncbi:hypothetical protein EJ08DRAFT_685651 [Tothia fuscella]|uniref:Dienelactone hydrolase domain-containing protein n=1 Tax=Tothia fuscella TaxID=1048955 RepID=A0A9P4NY95_9PEZI|nr:hypothetical protein EJ08DRAFT_685651 [Tothia fuscella]